MWSMYCVIDYNRRLSTLDRVVRVDHEYVRRVEIGLLTVIAIRGRAVKGHSLAVLNAAMRAALR